MNKVYQSIFLILLILILSSCNSRELRPDENTAVDKSNGLVFASVTRSKKKVNFINNRPVSATFVIQPVSKDDEETRVVKYDNDEGLFLTSHVGTKLSGGQINELSAYKGVDGRVTAIYLPPGEYEVVGWSLFVNQTTQSLTFTPKSFPPQTFNVLPGEATYLGNLHLDTIYADKKFLGTLSERGAKSTCSDESDRDIKEFQKKYHKFTSWNISKQLVKC